MDWKCCNDSICMTPIFSIRTENFQKSRKIWSYISLLRGRWLGHKVLRCPKNNKTYANSHSRDLIGRFYQPTVKSSFSKININSWNQKKQKNMSWTTKLIYYFRSRNRFLIKSTEIWSILWTIAFRLTYIFQHNLSFCIQKIEIF